MEQTKFDLEDEPEDKPQTQYKPSKPPTIGTLTRQEDSSRLVRCVQRAPYDMGNIRSGMKMVSVYIRPSSVEISSYLRNSEELKDESFDCDVPALREKFLAAVRKLSLYHVREVSSTNSTFIYYYDIRGKDKLCGLKID